MKHAQSNVNIPSPERNPLADRLRRQARAIDPEPPAGLRRRVFSALAELDATPQRPAWSAWVLTRRWFVATVAAAALVVIVLSITLRHQPAPKPLGAPHAPLAQRQQPSRPVSSPGMPFPSPVALAQQWIAEPMEDELRNLVGELSRTTRAVADILPAPAKRARPQPIPTPDDRRPTPTGMAQPVLETV